MRDRSRILPQMQPALLSLLSLLLCLMISALWPLVAVAQAPVDPAPVDPPAPLVEVRPGRSVTVIHNIDLVALAGYGPVGREVRVEIVRDGAVVGSTFGPTVNTPDGAGLEINHGPLGEAQPGECWNDVNPDIQPGDHIVVTDSEGRDEVIVDNIRFTGRPFQQGGGGALADVLVPFSAFDPTGAPIPLAAINVAEFRLGPRLRYGIEELRIEANEQGGAGAYFLRYSAPFTPARNRDLLSQEEVVFALLGPGHAVGYGNVDGAIPTATGTKAMLVEGVIDSTGPAAGCPFFPPPQPCAGADLTFDAAALQAPGTCPNPAVPGSLFASGFSCQPGCVAGASCVECGGLQCLDGVWSGISAAVCARDCALPALPLGTAAGSCTSATLSGHAGTCLLEALPFFVLRAGSLQLTCNDGVLSELPQLEEDTAAAAAAAAQAEADAAAQAEADAAAAAAAEAEAAAAAALAAEAEAAAAAQAEADAAAAAAAAAAQAEADAAAAAAAAGSV